MTLVKHNYKNLNNLFDEFFNAVPATWSKDFNVPAVNIHETDDAYHLELAAPGLNKEDFKLNVEKGLLTISYEKKTENVETVYKTHRREYTVSSFKRSFNVDENINIEAIEAKYDNGILKVLLPKKAEVKISSKEISIQ